MCGLFYLQSQPCLVVEGLSSILLRTILQGPMPTEEEWKERGLEKYGLIVVNQDGDAAQVEKVQQVCMFVCMCVFVCMFVCMYVYDAAQVEKVQQVCMFVCMYVCDAAQVEEAHLDIIHISMYMCVYIHTYIVKTTHIVQMHIYAYESTRA
jgi:hypothetical protein